MLALRSELHVGGAVGHVSARLLMLAALHSLLFHWMLRRPLVVDKLSHFTEENPGPVRAVALANGPVTRSLPHSGGHPSISRHCLLSPCPAGAQVPSQIHDDCPSLQTSMSNSHTLLLLPGSERRDVPVCGLACSFPVFPWRAAALSSGSLGGAGLFSGCPL